MEPQRLLHAGGAMQEPHVSAAYAGALQAFLRSRGFSMPGHSPATDAPLGRVAGRVFTSMLVAAIQALGDPLLGLRFGTKIGGAGFGMLGLTVATAATLRETILHLQRLEPITSTLGRTELHVGADVLSLVWLPALALPASVIDAAIAGWVSFGRYLIGVHADVAEVTFTHRASAARTDYEQILSCPVRFEAPLNSVRFASELLDAPLRSADPRLNGSLATLLAPNAAAIDWPARGSLTSQVTLLLGQGLELQDASAHTMAVRLHMSERTLQRRLADEGCTFRRLLDGARAQHAITRLFRGDTPLAEIGAQIGFDEQSSLCRAFQRWTSHSPLELKRRLAPVFSQLRPGDESVLQ